MPQQGAVLAIVPWAALFVGLALPFNASAAPEAGPVAPTGVWRGTSTCSDRVAAPGCHDEVVVYEFTPGAKPGTRRCMSSPLTKMRMFAWPSR